MEKTCITRKSNLELLRIIAMIMIVFSHFSDHGHFTFNNTEITINRLYLQFISMGGVIGDDLFVLISGYFLIDKDHIKVSKVIKMWLQLTTYSILIYLIAILAGYKEFNAYELIRNIFPITFEMWWFPSTYIILYLVSPLLNRALNNMNKQLFKIYIITFLYYGRLYHFLRINIYNLQI